jgi:hypothetical protein
MSELRKTPVFLASVQDLPNPSLSMFDDWAESWGFVWLIGFSGIALAMSRRLVVRKRVLK